MNVTFVVKHESLSDEDEKAEGMPVLSENVLNVS